MHRPNLFVIARFLRRLQECSDGVSKARLQVLVRANYDIFRRYLDLLQAQGHVTVDEDSGQVMITAGGTAALARLRETLREWLSEP